MTFTRPTIAQLIARAKSDIETRLPGADAQVRESVEAVLARVTAGSGHSLHGHLVWLSKQLFPDTAENEIMVKWAAIWGITKTAAVAANGTLDITGSNGSTCPDLTEWQDTNGNIYIQDGDATIAGGSATITLEADVAGADGNQSIGATLSLVSPVAGIDSDGTVSGTGITGGTDEEDNDALQARVLLRLQSPPKGGGPNDYVQWALEVAGVTRVWEIANGDGAGTVVVYFVRDNDSPIIPDSGEVTTAQNYLDTKAPITADVNVYAPTASPIAVTFTSLTPNTAAVQAAIEAELEALFLRAADPIGSTIPLSQINEAISIATGETDHVISAQAADITPSVGQLPTVGTSTFP